MDLQEKTRDTSEGMNKGTGNDLEIALLQMDVAIGNPDANYMKAEMLVEQAMKETERTPDVIVLPEMWNTGYDLDRIDELADVHGERTCEAMSALAKKHKVHIVAGSIAQKQSDGVTNTLYVFNREGEKIADYSKIHLFRLMGEDRCLLPGQQRSHAMIAGKRAGFVICYDIRFPELSRKLALEGASMLFVPAQWPHPRLAHWRTLLTARAIENQMFVIACNRAGDDVYGGRTTSFFGHSLVVDPWGEIIAEAGEEETIVRATIQLDEVERVRKKIPVFEDRRPSLY